MTYPAHNFIAYVKDAWNFISPPPPVCFHHFVLAYNENFIFFVLSSVFLHVSNNFFLRLKISMPVCIPP